MIFDIWSIIDDLDHFSHNILVLVKYFIINLTIEVNFSKVLRRLE